MKKLLLALAALLVFSAPALASNCPSYPYTFVNGQIANANQVNANFASILNCANSTLVAGGVNSTITSLTGLTTPLSVGQGGTGSKTAPGALANLGAVPAAGGVMTGLLQLPASTTSAASLNLPQGVSPTFPNTGDFWLTSTGLFADINGTPTKFNSFPRLVTISGAATTGFTLADANAVVYAIPTSSHLLEIDIGANATVPFDPGTQIKVRTSCVSSGFTTSIGVAGAIDLYWSPTGTLISAPGTFRVLGVCASATLTYLGSDTWVIDGVGIT